MFSFLFLFGFDVNKLIAKLTAVVFFKLPFLLSFIFAQLFRSHAFFFNILF